jgi:hypothetical protein
MRKQSKNRPAIAQQLQRGKPKSTIAPSLARLSGGMKSNLSKAWLVSRKRKPALRFVEGETFASAVSVVG